MTTRHLGATYVGYSVLTSDWDEQPGFLQIKAFILKQVLSCYYAPFLRLGGYKWYAYKGGTFSSLMLATIMTRCYQYLQTDNFGNDKPASSTSLSQLKIRWVFQDQYFLNRRFGSRLKWIILHNISLWDTNLSNLSMKMVYWPGFSRRRKWQGLKDD